MPSRFFLKSSWQNYNLSVDSIADASWKAYFKDMSENSVSLSKHNSIELFFEELAMHYRDNGPVTVFSILLKELNTV